MEKNLVPYLIVEKNWFFGRKGNKVDPVISVLPTQTATFI
jgi:hypothetical protein